MARNRIVGLTYVARHVHWRDVQKALRHAEGRAARPGYHVWAYSAHGRPTSEDSGAITVEVQHHEGR